jgi:diaminopimelate decarboxylase
MPPDVFRVQDDELCAGGLPLSEIARSVGTPFYVYAKEPLLERYRELESAFAGVAHLHCVALKANAQPALLRPLAALGAGAEVVSGAELALARELGFPAEKIVFSGVGKTERELEAGLLASVLMFLVESEMELEVLNAIAGERKLRGRVALRLNPDIDAKTHPHIATGVSTAKFGVDPEEARRLYRNHRAYPHLDFIGVHSHIGSQITAIEPLAENARTLAEWARSLRDDGVVLTHVDIGGGVGIRYRDEEAPSFAAYAERVLPPLAELGVTLVTEPGRALFGPVGAFVVRVLYVKRVHGRAFVVVDAGLNDLLRPALYGAYHRVVPLWRRGGTPRLMDVAGAVCESSDVFARDRELVPPERGDFLAILDAGAYGFVMSSNYNLRPRPAEVVVEDGGFRVVRPAETEAGLVARELASEASPPGKDRGERDSS